MIYHQVLNAKGPSIKTTAIWSVEDTDENYHSCCIQVLKFDYTILFVTAHSIQNLDHFYFRISFETNDFHTVIQWLWYILPFIKLISDINQNMRNFFLKKETKFCCKNIKNDFQYDLLHSTIILPLDYQFRKEVF